MDTKQLLYESFATMMVDSFYQFLCKLEKSDDAVDCPFMGKLHDIDNTLQKLFARRNPSTQSVQQVNKIANDPIPPKIKIIKKDLSTIDDKKRKCTDGNSVRSQPDDLFERMKKYIQDDVEGSDDSDCEMKPVSSEQLFQTDYPDECFKKEEKKDDVCCQDVSSSLRSSSLNRTSLRSSSLNRTSITVEDDPYIRLNPGKQSQNPEKLNESNGDINEPNYPYIVKVIDNVYLCQLCAVSNLPKNNVIPHVEGRQHKNAMRKQGGEIDLNLRLPAEIVKVVPIIKDVPVPVTSTWDCILCNVRFNCYDNVHQHVNGRQHNKKKENAQA